MCKDKAEDGAAQKIRIGIIGVTITGNMGGQAMLEAARQQLSAKIPKAEFCLFSVYGKADQGSDLVHDMEIVDTPPVKMLLIDFPISLLLLMIRSLFGAQAASWMETPMIRKTSQCDVMVDLAGIAFVSGRGLPLLAYNLACCLPSFATRTPHFKLSQALGPFQSAPYQWAGKWALSRCASVIARGEKTVEHVAKIGLKIDTLADTSFALTLSKDKRQQAEALFQGIERGAGLIIISPSRVTQRHMMSIGKDYVGVLSAISQKMLEKDYAVVILPHSLGAGSSKNNDFEVAQSLYQDIDQKRGHHGLHLIEPPQDAVILRAMFGMATMAITSRFHATVAALAMAVPPVVISWSFKYQELLAPFGLEQQVVGSEHFETAHILKLIDDIESHHQQKTDLLKKALPKIRKQAEQNFLTVARSLHSGESKERKAE